MHANEGLWIFVSRFRLRSLFVSLSLIDRPPFWLWNGRQLGENVSGNGQNTGRDADSDAALRARLEKLSHTLDAHRGEDSGPDGQGGAEGSGSLGAATNLGLQATIEFVTAIVVGPIIGWQIDSWFKTKPIFFIIFLFVGMVAGLMNVYRLAMRQPGQKSGQK